MFDPNQAVPASNQPGFHPDQNPNPPTPVDPALGSPSQIFATKNVIPTSAEQPEINASFPTDLAPVIESKAEETPRQVLPAEPLKDDYREITELAEAEKLQQTAFEVSLLYLNYRQNLALGFEARVEDWEEAAKKFPDFAGKIHELANLIREVEKVKKEAFPESDQILQKISFHNVTDTASQMLLADFLWGRAINSSGKFDRELNLVKEAVSILRELGFSEETIKRKIDVTPAEIAAAALSGKLRLKKLG